MGKSNRYLSRRTLPKKKRSNMTLKKGKKGEIGYCVKCRQKRAMQNCHVEKNMMKGVCPVCGTKMTRFMKKSA